MADNIRPHEIAAIFQGLEFIMEDSDAVFYPFQDNSPILALLQPLNVSNVPNFAEETVLEMNEQEFRRHFRIGKSVFDILLTEFGDVLQRKYGGREPVSPSKQLLVFLWYISNLESMREIANLFGISKSTVHECVHTVAHILSDHSSKFIKWPSEERMREIEGCFQAASNIPNVGGLIDGTHIRLFNLPGGQKEYINRKGFASVQLQVVVDDRLLITDAFVGWPGSTHDARVLRNSKIYERAENHEILDQRFIIGDTAYPVKTWLLTPYRDTGHLTARQRRLNKAMSGIRQTVERAIGHLKGRFRRLLALHCKSVDSICRIVMSACVLHNLCILTDDDIQDFIDMQDVMNVNGYQNIFPNAVAGEQRRNQLLQRF